MSNFDDIKKKIQSLKNKKPDTSISDNLNKIEMEINKDTLNMFRKNHEREKPQLASEGTIDNINTNFVTTSLIAQNQSFLHKTMKKDVTTEVQAQNEKESNPSSVKEDFPGKDKREDQLFQSEQKEQNQKLNSNPFSNQETQSKSTNSEDLIYKNNVLNYQSLVQTGQVKTKLQNDFFNNDIILGKTSAKSSTGEKSVKREKNSQDPKLIQGPSKIDEMRKLLDVGITERERNSKQKDAAYDDLINRNPKASSQTGLSTIQRIHRETAEIVNSLSGRSSNLDNMNPKMTNVNIQQEQAGTKLKDKISSLVRHFDKDLERPKNRKSEFDFKDKNMLILNNQYDIDMLPNKNSASASLNNYTSPKPRLELMTDKFFSAKSNTAKSTSSYTSDPVPNSRSNINNYISLTNKFQTKDKSTGKSDECVSGFDMFKKKLNRSNNYGESNLETTFKLEDIKTLANTLKFMPEETIKKISPSYSRELVNLAGVIVSAFKSK